MNEVLLLGREPGVWLTVRSIADRVLLAESAEQPHKALHLRDALAGVAPCARIHVVISATAKRKARIAKVEVSTVHFSTRLRAPWSKCA